MAVEPTNPPLTSVEAGFNGMRLSAEEYYALPDDGNRYELIDGVVIMSPSATPRHQLIAGVIYRQLAEHVDCNKLGLVLYETDVRFGRGQDERDLIYRPEIVFVAADRLGALGSRIEIVPDLVVEVISPDSRHLDSVTKRNDYERVGVREYWLIDPQQKRMTFLRLGEKGYVEAPSTGDAYTSEVVPGFTLDLSRVRDAFEQFQ